MGAAARAPLARPKPVLAAVLGARQMTAPYVRTYLLSDWVIHYLVGIDLQGDRVVFHV